MYIQLFVLQNLRRWLNALKFYFNATHQSYRGEVYQKTFGTTMGSPVSVFAAYLVMEDVEHRGLSTCEFQIPFWVCGQYPKGISTKPDPAVSPAPELNRAYHPVYHQKELKGTLPFQPHG